MKNLLRERRRFFPPLDKLSSWREILLRVPISLGMICLVYLMIGLLQAAWTGARSESSWLQGAYKESYIAASLLVYTTLVSTAILVAEWEKGKIQSGRVLIVAGLWVGILLFSGCFQHKIRGAVIWPM